MMNTGESTDKRMEIDVIEDELKDVRKRCEAQVNGSQLVTCVRHLIQVVITKGGCKQVTLNLRYPDSYPRNAILVELKSKTMSESFLASLDKLCDQQCKDRIGKPHALQIIMFVSQFLEDNVLSACFDEVQYIRQRLINDRDSLKIKQKQGVLTFQCNEDNYYMHFSFTITDNYPNEPAVYQEKSTNFPASMCKVFSGNVTEILRQCVEPPLRKNPKAPPFQPQPSLKAAVEYLITDCIRRCSKESCSLCDEKALPDDPDQVILDPNNSNHLERIYCGHFYHYGCLNKYMTTPPFKNGKPCAVCKKRIYHERWTPNVNLAEARWAHKQARERELNEVADFLK